MKTLNEKFGLFPQQYVIGPKFVDCFEFGKKYEIAPSFLITSHPELNVSNIVLGHRSLTLIGYILDPNKPDHDNFQVIEELLLENSSFEEVVESTFELCGNWILLYKEDQQVFLFMIALESGRYFIQMGAAPMNCGLPLSPGLLPPSWDFRKIRRLMTS